MMMNSNLVLEFLDHSIVFAITRKYPHRRYILTPDGCADMHISLAPFLKVSPHFVIYQLFKYGDNVGQAE